MDPTQKLQKPIRQPDNVVKTTDFIDFVANLNFIQLLRRQVYVHKKILLLVISVAALGLTACSTPAPPYAVSIPNVQAIKSAASSSLAVGEFGAQGSAANNESISIRGNPMVSASGTFAKYLQNAIVQELTEARLLDPNSTMKITAVLLKNDISAAGILTASAEIEARFAVTKVDKTVFEKIKRARIEWDSNFLGAIAIPRAQQNYPNLVSALLKELYADQDFVAALKK